MGQSYGESVHRRLERQRKHSSARIRALGGRNGAPVVLLAGALIARLQPAGMARVLYLTALAQALITGIALITVQNPEVLDILLVNGFFAAVWVGSGWMFQHAGSRLNRQAK